MSEGKLSFCDSVFLGFYKSFRGSNSQLPPHLASMFHSQKCLIRTVMTWLVQQNFEHHPRNSQY